MSYNKRLFESIYQDGLKYVERSTDRNIKSKVQKLNTAYMKVQTLDEWDVQELFSVIHELKIHDFLYKFYQQVKAHSDDSAGPDFETPNEYVECVIITKGMGENRRVTLKSLDGQFNRASSTITRITSAIADKQKKISYYLNTGVIKDKPIILAISPGAFAYDINTNSILDVVLSVLYGIGNRMLSVKQGPYQTKTDSPQFHNYIDKHIKNTATEIQLDLFSNVLYSNISAVLFVNATISEELNSGNIVLLINPKATHPVVTETLNRIKSLRLVKDDQFSTDYRWFDSVSDNPCER